MSNWSDYRAQAQKSSWQKYQVGGVATATPTRQATQAPTTTGQTVTQAPTEQLTPPEVQEFPKIPTWAKIMSPFWTSPHFIAGWGDVYKTAGGAATWMGAEGIGEKLSTQGQELQQVAPPDMLGEFNWKMLFNPRFYTTRVIRSLPFVISLIPAAIAGGYAGAGVAGAVGLGALGKLILGSIGAAALSRPLESAMEAGGAYDAALEKGLSREEADRAADETFWKNMALVGMDAAEFALAFAPTPIRLGNKFLRYAMIGGKLVAVGLSEAGEEAYQDVIQRQALGEEIKLDAQMQEAMAIGGIFGLGLGGAGEAFTSIQQRTVDNLSAATRNQFEAEKAGFTQQGYTDKQSTLLSLDSLAETRGEEITSIVENIVGDIKQEQFRGESETIARTDWATTAMAEGTVSGKPEFVSSIETRIAEISKQLEVKGLRGKETLRLELATLEAQREVMLSETAEDIQSALQLVEGELGLRSMPFQGYGGKSKIDLARHPTARLFKGYTTKQLDEMRRVYLEALESPIPATPREVPTEPITGEQAGMLGVPQGVFTQRGIGKPVTASMEDFAKLQQARREVTPAPEVEPESLYIPEELPTIPPPITPVGRLMGREDNRWRGFMADLQDAETVAKIAFRNDATRRIVNTLPGLQKIFGTLSPNVVAGTAAEKYTIIKSVLVDESGQKTQGVMAHVQEAGTQEEVFGKEAKDHTIESGPLKGYTVGYVAEHRGRFEAKLTPQQKLWLDRANTVEQACTEFAERNGIELGRAPIEEGGQFATRRVYAQKQADGTIIETGYIGAAPRRPGAKLPSEKGRVFGDEAEALKAGYVYIPYEEALYLRVQGTQKRVADKIAADWLLTQVPWRTTGAPEELILAAEAARLKLRHSQSLLAALNRAVRGERVPDVTINSIARSYPDQAQQLKALIPRIQAGETTARDVQRLTRTAKGLIQTNQMSQAKAVSARARARERAMTPVIGEGVIPAPAFAGKILTGPDAKETARTVTDSFNPKFSDALGEINKFNAVSRYFMLAGDVSYPMIQLIFMMGENPKAYGRAMAGAIRSIFDPKFHTRQLALYKDVIDRHPNMQLTIHGRTEMTAAMARGGWLSGEVNLHPEGEKYLKTVGLLIPRVAGKVGAKVLKPFERGFEAGLDLSGIYLAMSNEHMAKTPEDIADLDMWIDDLRGLGASARLGVSGLQRQRETAILLAPRYNRAIASWLWSMGRGGLRGKLARRSLARGVTAIAIMGVLISLARGESEDEIIEHFNPNSPKFFTWDIAGQKIGPGSKVRSLIKLFAQSTTNPDELLEFSMDNPALRFLRGNLAPALGSSVDLISGRSYIGEPTRDGMLSFSREMLAGNLLPIWVQATLMEGGDPGGRTARGLAEFFGWRAYPEPLWDEVGRLRDRYAKQDFRTDYKELNRAQVDQLTENHPDLVELEGRARLESAERGNEFEHAFFLMKEATTQERDDDLEEIANLLLNGTITKYQYDKDRGYIRPYYSGGMSVLYGFRDRLDPDSIKDIQEWMADNQKPEDKALDEYQKHRAMLIDDATLPRDWDKIDEQSQVFLSTYPLKIRNYVNDNLNRWINKLPENAKRVERMRLKGIEDDTWWDDYRGTTTGGGWQQYGGGSTSGGSSWQQYGK